MLRLLFLCLVLIASLALLNCQSYTKGLQQSVVKADEVSAIAALHSLASAQASYAASNGGGYGSFQQLAAGDFIDARFNADKPQNAGYTFSMLTQKSEGEPPSFSCTADPTPPGAGRHFYIDSTSIVRVNATQPATASDPVFQP